MESIRQKFDLKPQKNKWNALTTMWFKVSKYSIEKHDLKPQKT